MRKQTVIVITIFGLLCHPNCVSDRTVCEWNDYTIEQNTPMILLLGSSLDQCVKYNDPTYTDSNGNRRYDSEEECRNYITMLMLMMYLTSDDCEKESDIPIWPKIVYQAPGGRFVAPHV